MIAKIIRHFWSLRKEFAKYFIIGISAFLADIGSLYILKEKLNLTPTLAVVLNQPLIILGVFYLNKHWSFRAEGITHRQMIRFVSLAIGNYCFSIIWMYVLHSGIGAQYLFARTANIALSVAWNFLLYKHWVYRP